MVGVSYAASLDGVSWVLRRAVQVTSAELDLLVTVGGRFLEEVPPELVATERGAEEQLWKTRVSDLPLQKCVCV